MNIFLDCGFYVGGALRKYIDLGIVDKTWEIIVFEPNTEFNIQPHLDKFEDIPIKVIKKAVWTEDGTVKFEASERENAAHLTGTTYHDWPRKMLDVPCIDFSEYVKDLPKDARIICSMDIEGSEFPILEKMLKDKTVQQFEILDIEFHHRFMPDVTEKDSQKLIDEIEKVGVKVELKESLT